MSQNIPKGALRFVAPDCHAHCFADEGEDKKTRLNMTVYSGKPIEGHWYWGKLVMDLSGVSVPSKFPVLEDHMTYRKIGFSSKPVVSEEGIKLDPDKTSFVDTPESAEFQKLSKEGFPFQSSLYGTPTALEKVREGETVEVNGFKFSGPGYVWRKWRFNEASICVFGWDNKTSASAFSKDVKEEIDIELMNGASLPGEETFSDKPKQEQQMKEVIVMDLKELKEKNPQLMSQIVEEVRTELEASFSKEREQFQNTINALQKNDAIRTAQEIEAKADRVWTSKLSKSTIAEDFFSKVRPMVPYSKFVKDGVFDEAAFSKAVEDEIKDWEGRLTSRYEVKGISSFSTETPSQDASIESETKGLLAMVGIN